MIAACRSALRIPLQPLCSGYVFHAISPASQARMRELEELDADQRRRGLPAPERFCQVPPETARFLALTAALAPDGACVELGTSAGYSTMWLALGRAGRGSRIQTCERSEWKLAEARRTFEVSGLESAVELIPGDAKVHLEACREVAFCFLDLAKTEYLACYELLVPRLTAGGVLVADNILSHGDVLAPFVEHVLADPRVDAVVLSIGKGLLFARKVA